MKAKRQYLLTLQLSRYSLLALKSSAFAGDVTIDIEREEITWMDMK